jgi:hypothetical protein
MGKCRWRGKKRSCTLKQALSLTIDLRFPWPWTDLYERLRRWKDQGHTEYYHHSDTEDLRHRGSELHWRTSELLLLGLQAANYKRTDKVALEQAEALTLEVLATFSVGLRLQPR